MTNITIIFASFMDVGFFPTLLGCRPLVPFIPIPLVFLHAFNLDLECASSSDGHINLVE